MDNVENSILNKLVTNAYREEARNYTTDSLMNNLNTFERQVETRLKKDFENKFLDFEDNLTIFLFTNFLLCDISLFFAYITI